MKNIFEQLTDLLKKDERLVSQDGVLLKNQTQELTRKNDADLIKRLISDPTIKQHFFFEIEKVLIFDKEKFIRFISNKQFLPNSYTTFKNKIGLTTGNEYVSENKEVVLVWPYKDCILEGGMTKEDQKRDEIFYNESLAPDEINRLLDAKAFTNFKRIDKDGEHKLDGFKRDEKGTIKDNLIIKGNNLLALASLKKEFAGKVKLIYIDPPFAKEADSFYNDAFKRSTWLTFMKNRLEVAQDLLEENGFIFIHIDDKQEAYLKVLCDSVFKEDNFLKTISVKVSPPNGVKIAHSNKQILKEKETILVYCKNSNNVIIKPQYKKADKWDKHFSRFIENYEKGINYWEVIPLTQVLKKNKLKPDLDNVQFVNWINKNSDRIFQSVDLEDAEENQTTKIKTISTKPSLYSFQGRQVQFLKSSIKETPDGVILARLVCDFWTDISFNNLFQEGGVKLKNGKKPERLLERIINLTTNEEDIVLDYHLGSGTTCAVAHKMNRQFIGLEQLDYGENDSVVRIKNVISGDQSGISKFYNWQGGGDFVYMELAKWNEEWIERIEKAKTGKELVKLWDEMKEAAFLSYKVEPKMIDANVNDFTELSITDQKKLLIECLDKNQLYINLSEIEDKEYEIEKEDKELNKNFYGSK